MKNKLSSQKLRRIFGVSVLLASLVLLAWGYWPVPLDTRALALSPADMRLPLPLEAGLPPTIPENRNLILSWPARVRLGDVAFIQLTLVVDAQGRLSTGLHLAGGRVRNDFMQVMDIFDTHRVLVESRLEMASVHYSPPGQVSVALLPGQPVALLWSVRPDQQGVYPGTIWVHLRFLPLDSGEELRRVLTAQPIQIQATSLLGLSGEMARLLGGLGLAFGLVLGLDGVVMWLVGKKKLDRNP